MKKLRVAAIVPAAGLGKRLGLKTKKPFVKLGGKPIVVHVLSALNRSPSVDSIITATEPSCVKRLEDLARDHRLFKVRTVIAGGRTRTDSVRRCLRHVGPRFDIVLIHDGARPFIEEKMIKGSIDAASRYGACVVAVPESDTVKIASGGMFVKKTVDRKIVYRAQTPQTFRRDVIIRAYAPGARTATDDSALAEIAGSRVKILNGSYRNIKITTRSDLQAAEAML